MKILLPNGNETRLDDSLTIELKLVEVERLLLENSESILSGWNTDGVKFFLDSLSNYLIWHKEDGDRSHDKEVMSRNKTNRMVRGRKDTPFSSLSKQSKDTLFYENGGSE